MTTQAAAATDRVTLVGLRAYGRHGCLPAERDLGQEFVVDVGLGIDTARAAATDDLAHTVDYGVLARRLVAVVEGEPVNLLETLAQRLADVCLNESMVREVEVTVHKPSAPIPHPVTDVTVRIHRKASSATGHEATGAEPRR
jgi:7,8-dihydroneopterin aldolase/epimerase/oxygenase